MRLYTMMAGLALAMSFGRTTLAQNLAPTPAASPPTVAGPASPSTTTNAASTRPRAAALRNLGIVMTVVGGILPIVAAYDWAHGEPAHCISESYCPPNPNRSEAIALAVGGLALVGLGVFCVVYGGHEVPSRSTHLLRPAMAGVRVGPQGVALTTTW